MAIQENIINTKLYRSTANLLQRVNKLELPVPQGNVYDYPLVEQRYSQTYIEGLGRRSTCVITAVMNAARMIGINVPDCQDSLIRDRRIPWVGWGGGGIYTDNTTTMNDLALILEEYLVGTTITCALGWSFKKTLASLKEGKGMTMFDKTFHHSVAVAGLYCSEESKDSSSCWSWLVDTDDLEVHQIDWLHAITGKSMLGVRETYGVSTQAHFCVEPSN